MKKYIFIVILFSLILSGCSLLSPQKIERQTNTEINNNPTNINENLKTETNNNLDGQSTVATGDSKPVVTTSIANKNTLDLSGQALNKIPDNVFKQTNLQELNVANNLLTGAIQGEIRHLQNLVVLNASNNQMTGVPAEIGQLKNLEVLNLANNQLTGLPYELGNLNKLKVLNISGNNYSELDLKIITEKLPADVKIIK